MRRIAVLITLALLLMGCGPGANGQPVFDSDTHRFVVETLVEGLEHPWAMAFLPDGEVLIPERPGRLRSWRDGRLSAPIAGLPEIHATGQGGLLDLALHPHFAENRWLYFSYAARHQGGTTTHVARGQYRDGRLSHVEVLFIALPASDGGRHFGSRLVFDAAGYLFITVGDRGEMPRAQRLDDHAGSTLRLHDDGRVPEDNPFITTPAALPELYTIGNRNAQGMTLHPITGEVWQHEHGPRGGDEINIIRAGLNYGWPVISHGIDYSGRQIGEGIREKEGMQQPLHYWSPSIAPSGMDFYTGEAFPHWQGNLFVGALAHRHLARLVLEGDKVVHEEQLLRRLGKRIRDVRQGPDGLLWLLTDERNGAMLRLSPDGGHGPIGMSSSALYLQQFQAVRAVIGKGVIAGDEGHAVADGGVDQQAIERVFVPQLGELMEAGKYHALALQYTEPGLPGVVGQFVRHQAMQLQLAQGIFEGDLPKTEGADIDLFRLLNSIHGLGRDFFRLHQPPQQDMGIDQIAHLSDSPINSSSEMAKSSPITNAALPLSRPGLRLPCCSWRYFSYGISTATFSWARPYSSTYSSPLSRISSRIRESWAFISPI